MELKEKWGWKRTPVPEQMADESGEEYQDRLMHHFLENWVLPAVLRKKEGELGAGALEDVRQEFQSLRGFFRDNGTEECERLLDEIFGHMSRYRKISPKSPRRWGYSKRGSGLFETDLIYTLGLTIPQKNQPVREFYTFMKRDKIWFERIGYRPGMTDKEMRARMKYSWVMATPEDDFGYWGTDLRKDGIYIDTEGHEVKGETYFVFRWVDPDDTWCRRPVKVCRSREELDAWFENGASDVRKPPKRRAFSEPQRDYIRKGRKNSQGVVHDKFFSALRVPNAGGCFKKSLPQYARQYFVDLTWDSASDLMDVVGFALEDFCLGGHLKLRFSCGSGRAMAQFVRTVNRLTGDHVGMTLEMAEAYSGACVAHEWWHAVHFSVGQYLDEKDKAAKRLAWYDHDWNGATPLEKAVMEDPRLEAYRARCAKLDSGRGSSYYFTDKEMLARLFEGYVFVKLREKGVLNRHLMSPQGIDVYVEGDLRYGWGEMPSYDEIAVMTPYFDAFFRELRTYGILTSRREHVYYERENGQFSFFEGNHPEMVRGILEKKKKR